MNLSFKYTPNNINELEKSISSDRLSTYMQKTKDDKEKALNLYLWNSQISAAFYIPLQGLEVTLRNSLHTALSNKFGRSDWYDYAPLDAFSNEAVKKSKETVQKDHHGVNPPHVVAELSFGFWVSLLKSQYHQTLWIPALGKAFPNANNKRGLISDIFNHRRIFRNRIAHHEPIFTRNLEEDYKKIIEAISWMNSEKAKWIDSNNNVIELLKYKPV